jgi:flagellar protein FlgJ
MTSSITALAPASTPAADHLGKLKQQAHDLEGVFLNTLMKEMFGSIKTDDKDLGGGFGEQTWRGMQAEQMANAVADSGGIGLADSILSELLSAQETSQQSQPMPELTR